MHRRSSWPSIAMFQIPTPHALFLVVCNSTCTQGWKYAWNILFCFYVMLWPRWLVTGLTLCRPRFIQSQSTLDVWWERALFCSTYSTHAPHSYFIHLPLILHNPSKSVSFNISLSPILLAALPPFLPETKGCKKLKPGLQPYSNNKLQIPCS